MKRTAAGRPSSRTTDSRRQLSKEKVVAARLTASVAPCRVPQADGRSAPKESLKVDYTKHNKKAGILKSQFQI